MDRADEVRLRDPQARRIQGDLLAKSGIHPDYRRVVFEDSSGRQRWICRSAIITQRRTTWEGGEEYPHVLLEVSNDTRPFYTGNMTIIDTAGRVERFNKRYGNGDRG
jgi:large subunit ribosomal protein L31